MSALAAYRILVPYLRRYWQHYVAGMLCLLIIIGGQLLVPQYIRLAIDTLVGGAPARVRMVASYMAQLIAVTVVIAATRFGWRHFLAITARRIESNLRDDVYATLTTLSHDFYARYATGDIIARLTNDLRAVRMACGFAIVSVVDGVVMSLAIIILLFSRYPALTLYLLAPLPLISGLVFVSGKVIVRRYAQVQRAFSRLTEQARHALTNMRTIKAAGREEYFSQKFNRSADEYKQHSLDYARFWSLVFPTILCLATCANLLLVIFGGRAVIRGEITVGDFAAITTYLEMLLWPMVGLGFTINLFAQGATACTRIGELLRARPLIRSRHRGARQLAARFDIAVANLRYAYPDLGRQTRVLTDISMSIPAGAHIGIIGKTAAGKSTLAQLLPRLLEAPAGTITIDGHDIRAYAVAAVRRAICLVTQRPFLFSESVADNIRFGLDDPTTAAQFARIIDAAAIPADAPEFPAGLATEIGENGIMISGGQKQRVAIARALITEPPVLIFDDTFSSLDAETEQHTMKRVRALRSNKSTVFISNRVQALSHCQHIYVLSDGTIAQQGTYEQLIRAPGLFQTLYHLQVPTKTQSD